MKLSTGFVTKLLGTSSFKSLLDGCFIDIYSGTQPATADAVPSGTKLCTVSLNGTATGLTWNAPTSGTISKTTAEVWTGTPGATGTAAWFRCREATDDGLSLSTTAVRFDGSVGTTGTDMITLSTAVTTGVPFAITAAQFTLPQA